MSFLDDDEPDSNNIFARAPQVGDVRGHGRVIQMPFRNPTVISARKCEVATENSRTVSLDDENADKFSQKFKREIRRLTTELNEVEDAFDKEQAGLEKYEESESKRLLLVGEEINELQQYITSSTRFLPDFAIKTFQELLSTLITRHKEVRQKIMPVKKFQFNSKKKKPTANKEPLTLEEIMARNERLKETLIAKKHINVWRTSELSLDLNDCFEKYILEVGNRVNKHDITLTNMRNCFIEIRGHPGSIRLKNVVKCVLLCGPTTFSIYGEDCQQNIFALACHQFRIHFSNACKIFLHVTSRAVMEECNGIEIGPYNYKYDNLEQDFKDSGLDIKTNNYANMADFNWLSSKAPSPNWQLTEEQMNWDELRQQFREQVMKSESP